MQIYAFSIFKQFNCLSMIGGLGQNVFHNKTSQLMILCGLNLKLKHSYRFVIISFAEPLMGAYKELQERTINGRIIE